jgi:hypothetical protein
MRIVFLSCLPPTNKSNKFSKFNKSNRSNNGKALRSAGGGRGGGLGPRCTMRGVPARLAACARQDEQRHSSLCVYF